MLQRWGILAAFWICTLDVPAAVAQEEALCAEVRIEILQELTLERQGFEAIMRITNSLDTYSIEDIAITVNFTDADGNAVTATSNTAASDAEFFIRVDDTQNINSLVTGDDGAVTDGVIQAGKVGEFRWLIVPTANAAGQTDNGELYFVGATLSYSYGGKEELVQVAPDSIVVKPQPLLTLDYFLTQEVIGDDAFTTEIEPPEPYTLGVRIDNSGYGTARNVKIESAQPRIVDNEQGLAIDFTITKSFVENQPAEPTLLINFGEIAPQSMKTGRWVMESTLSGKFTEFSASFTHADELGGELTSLIEATNAHLLVKDVLVDLPGRDAVLDFLAYGAGGDLYLYESENTGADLALCKSCAQVTSLSYTLGSENGGSRVLSGAVQEGFGFIQVSDPYAGAKVLHRVVRGDGKTLNPNNYWLSKKRADDKVSFNYFINIFDYDSSPEYTLYFVDSAELPQPPVIQAILDRTSHEGGQIGFLVQASDPNGTVPQLSSSNLPSGATFTDGGDGTGIFRWQPAIGQAGNYVVTFTATDGALSTQRSVNLKVNPADDTDGDGLSDAWEREHFGNLDRDGTGDYDGDGRTDAQEEEVGSDPTVPEVAPGAPQIASPVFDAEILDGAAELLPTLEVTNGQHDPELTVAYQFEIYSDEAMLTKVAEATVDEGNGSTRWTVAADALLPGQSFADNSLYFWRVRAITVVEAGSNEAPVASNWEASRFFINTANDAPSAPAIIAPQVDAILADTRPELIVAHAFDADRDALTYGFDLFHESDLDTPIASVNGLLPGGNFQTKWQVPNPLDEDSAYIWKAWVEDEHGARTESAIGSFLVSVQNNAPTEPSIVSPVGGLSEWLPNNGVELRVANASDPEQQPLTYFFELDTVASFDSGAVISSGPVTEGDTETAWIIEGLQEDLTYYWRAKVSDGEVESNWVSASFQVDSDNSAPPVPSLQNPGDGAVVESLRPLFEVNPVIDPDGDAVQYRFEVYSDAELTLLVASQQQADTQWTPGFDFNDNSHYYWRARAEDAKGMASDWSPVNRFAINENAVNDPPQITLVLPDSAVTVSGPQLLIQWQDSDPDSNATVSLYYLYEGGSRTLIVTDIPEDEDGEGDQYLWDVSGLLPGNYTLEAEITDGETTVTASGCCTITVPSQSKRITVTPLTPLETDEAGTVIAAVEVSLDQPLQAGTSLTLNLSITDETEAEILGDHYLQFTAENWDIPQTIRLRGLDDCNVDGDSPFSLVFQPAQTDDPAYSGYLLDSIAFVNRDSESAGQTLFICRYQLEEQVPLSGTDEVESHYRVQLDNQGVALVDASATLTLLPSPDLNYAAEIVGSNRFTFSDIPFAGSVLSNEILVIRHPAGQALDFAKFSWDIEAGESQVDVEGNSGNNTLHGSVGADIIDGKAGNDTIYAGDGDDVIIGGPGADQLYGEGGNDTFIVEGNDGYADRFEGGEGFDQVLGGSGDDAIRLSVFSGSATVERIDGAGGYNIIYGTSGNNILDFSDTELVNIAFIDGLAGNDTIYGSSADDKIIGGSGNDQLYGNAGDDIFYIEGVNSGTDRVEGGTGLDKVVGSDGDDWFRFSVFSGEARVEVIDGGEGNNQILGTSANNTLDFRDVTLLNIARLDAGAGNDTVYGSSAADVIVGGLGSDNLYGEGGDDRFLIIAGDTGFDRYDGGEGEDWLVGTPSDDDFRLRVFSGNATVEVIDGDGGYNRILGSSANNTLDFSNTQLISIDLIDAGAGNDTVKGSSAADVIEGGLGSDLLYGNGGADIFLLTAGDTGFDQYRGGEGTDRILGADGDDEIRLSVFSGEARVEIIDGGAGNNRIVGSSANNTLDFSETQLLNIAEIDAGAGNDTVYGSQGADRILGGPGSDYLYGEGGDDTFVVMEGDSGADRINGGEGFDTLLGSFADDNIVFSVFGGSATVERIDGGAGTNRISGTSANNTLDFRNTELVNIALINGAEGNDTIYGTSDADVIEGGLGSDTVYGEGGDDIFKLTPGDTGADSYRGGEGRDTLLGTSGDDLFRFSVFAGEASVEVIDGNGGTDRIVGTTANNTLDFSATELIGIASIDAGSGNDTIYGSPQADTIVGGLGSDYLVGGDGDDTFLFTAGDTGADKYSGGKGDDQLLGSAEDDDMIFSVFSGANTVERIDGGEGVNRLFGTSANNTLDFRETQLVNISSIHGAAGNDTIYGSSADDVIEGGIGSDTLYGSAGDDTFIVTPGDTGYDRYQGDEGSDTLLGTDGDDEFRLSFFSGDATVETIDGKAGTNRIVGSSANNTLDFRNTELIAINRINGGAGNDTIYGSQGDDFIEGGIGSDNLYGEGGDDVFLLTAGDTGYDRYSGGAGVDEVRGSSGNDLIRLASYSGAYTVEVINGNGGVDYIQGTTGNNTLDFSTTVLTAIAEIRGEKGNDTILGSQGADTIRGGAGNDTLQGNAGADIYVFARGDGVDTINDRGSSAGDTLLFEGAIAPEDIWLVKNGNHLDIYLLAGAEKVQVRNWKSSESAIEVIATEADAELPLANIDALAELMTAIGVPQNGVISLSGDQQAQVAEARNTAWQ
ncbi:putative Ig domain-containing protein [Microbulbifer thermotolerans]|uniref:Ig domain-containing protein n=1 Tax=Microbulbifer thermotolerans TaxID=252514 RepID=A0AB35HXP2_MICTH|nr:putative Ig domain-containing protein [Microbulbifer thermotolerans]MCX2802075.1 putative Ig domain-containing protein [Microbulbifer thermotolerans]